MAETRNPYAPPTAHVADKIDVPSDDTPGRFIPNGRTVSAGRGAGWIGDAWRIFRARPGKWLLSIFIVLLIYGAVSWIPVVSLVTTLMWPFVSAGIVAACDLQRRTGTFELEELFAGFRKPVPLLVIGGMFFLTFVVFYALLATMVGTDVANQVLLNIGGPVDPASVMTGNYGMAMLIYMAIVLPITAATFFAPPLILFNDLPPGTAMKMSLIGAFRNILPGLVFSVCTLLFVIASMIPLGLGLFVSIPVLMLTAYTMYRDIFIEKD